MWLDWGACALTSLYVYRMAGPGWAGALLLEAEAVVDSWCISMGVVMEENNNKIDEIKKEQKNVLQQCIYADVELVTLAALGFVLC